MAPKRHARGETIRGRVSEPHDEPSGSGEIEGGGHCSLNGKNGGELGWGQAGFGVAKIYEIRCSEAADTSARSGRCHRTLGNSSSKATISSVVMVGGSKIGSWCKGVCQASGAAIALVVLLVAVVSLIVTRSSGNVLGGTGDQATP